MFLSKQVKQNLLGCFEIVLFMKAGFDRFSNSRSDALKSFLIVLVILPLILGVRVIMSPEYSPSLIVFLYTPITILALVGFLGLVFCFSKHYERTQYFYKYLNVVNWFNIAMLALTSPLLVAIALGAQESTQFESYAVFMIMVGYLYSGYILTHVFRVPWELGGFVAIFGMLIDQTLLEFADHIRDALHAV